MLSLTRYIFITVFVTYTGYAWPELTLKDPACNTKCDEHSNYALDSCTFMCVVDLGESPTRYEFSFQIFTSSHNGFLSEPKFRFPSECDKFNDCKKIKDRIFQAELSLKADTNNRDAIIRCVLNAANATSNTRRLPNISELKYFTWNLTINGQSGLAESNCSMDVTENQINLEFVCHTIQCVINISVNEQTPSQHTGRAKMSLELRNGKVVNVSLKYGPCSLDQRYSTINCRIKSESYDSEHIHTDSLVWAQENISIVIVCFLAGLVIGGAIIGLIYFIRTRRLCPGWNNEQHTVHGRRVGDVDRVVGHQENRPEAFPLQEIDESAKHQKDQMYLGSSG